MKIAVIDIGTNSIHMLIAELLPNFTFEVIGREKEMTRLGDGTLSSGILSAKLMQKGLQTLKRFQHLAMSKGAQKIVAIATSAVRESKNGGDFIQKILKETGIQVRVITGTEEARLIYLGIKHSIQLNKEPSLMIDAGGGSVELIVGNNQKILLLKSLKMGVARLKDLFIKQHKPEEFKAIEQYVETSLKKILPSFKTLSYNQVIGSAGTLNNLAAMAHYRKEKESSTLPRNLTLTREALEELYEKLKKSTPEERLKMRGLDPKREDLITSGAALIFTLMKQFEVSEIQICDKAIREGVVYDFIAHNRVRIKTPYFIPNIRRRNIFRLAHKCDYERKHAEHVALLALKIFDQTQNLHQLNSTDRELLEYGALLHDIGYYISYEKHHRHAYYLIKNVHLNGFSEEEIDLLALMVRYHRKTNPKKSHPEHTALPKALRKKVEWLAALLKMADALDRSHFGLVEDLKITSEKTKIFFNLKIRDDAQYEVWDAKRRSVLFEKLAKKTVFFKTIKNSKASIDNPIKEEIKNLKYQAG